MAVEALRRDICERGIGAEPCVQGKFLWPQVESGRGMCGDSGYMRTPYSKLIIKSGMTSAHASSFDGSRQGK